MTPRFLLDTPLLSEPASSRPNPHTLRLIRERLHLSATAAPVVHELAFGYLRMPPSRKRTFIQRYIDEDLVRNIPILAYDEDAARWHAAERARLTALGLTPPFVDGQIAAIATVNGLVLVTANIDDFQHFRGLQVENWQV